MFADGIFVPQVEGGRHFSAEDYPFLKSTLALYASRCLVKENEALLATDCDILNYGLCEYRGINI